MKVRDRQAFCRQKVLVSAAHFAIKAPPIGISFSAFCRVAVHVNAELGDRDTMRDAMLFSFRAHRQLFQLSP